MEPAREAADVATGAVATAQSSERRAIVTAIVELAARKLQVRLSHKR